MCRHTKSSSTNAATQPELPSGLGAKLAQLGLASTYEDSGWCYVELTSSTTVKKKGRRLDLSKCKSATGYANVAIVDRLKNGATTLIEEGQKQRTPPIHPDEMKKELATVKKFTSKGDVSALLCLRCLNLPHTLCLRLTRAMWVGLLAG